MQALSGLSGLSGETWDGPSDVIPSNALFAEDGEELFTEDGIVMLTEQS